MPGATHAGSVADVAWLIHNFSSRSRCIEGAVATAVPSAPGRSRLRGLFALMHSCTCHNIYMHGGVPAMEEDIAIDGELRGLNFG